MSPWSVRVEARCRCSGPDQRAPFRARAATFRSATSHIARVETHVLPYTIAIPAAAASPPTDPALANVVYPLSRSFDLTSYLAPPRAIYGQLATKVTTTPRERVLPMGIAANFTAPSRFARLQEKAIRSLASAFFFLLSLSLSVDASNVEISLRSLLRTLERIDYSASSSSRGNPVSRTKSRASVARYHHTRTIARAQR